MISSQLGRNAMSGAKYASEHGTTGSFFLSFFSGKEGAVNNEKVGYRR